MLEARGVTKRFGGLTAVNDVDLVVHDREIVGLIGPNGAGKTTFFNCLTGMEVPTAGEVCLFSATRCRESRTSSPQLALRARFQNIRLFHNMTALENVQVGGHTRTTSASCPPSGVGRSSARDQESVEKAREMLAFVGLSKVADTVARNLAYGDQRRLELPALSRVSRACCCSTSRRRA